MTDEYFSPVQVFQLYGVDSRLAKMSISSENSPKMSDGSLDLKGYVAFGQSTIKSESRIYRIGVRHAFLEPTEYNCVFDPNQENDRNIQKSSMKVEHKRDRKISSEIGGSISGNVSFSKASGNIKGNLGASGKYSENESTIIRREINSGCWEAGGYSFGKRGKEVATDEDGILRGYVIQGIFGKMIPLPNISQCEITFTLTVASGNLSVIPEKWSLSDALLGGKNANEKDAFEALKSKVAAWIIGDELPKPKHRTGFNYERDEVVLAESRIIVNLNSILGNKNLNERMKEDAASGHEALCLPARAGENFMLSETQSERPSRGAKRRRITHVGENQGLHEVEILKSRK